MQISYGVIVTESDAQIQLLALCSSIFPMCSKNLEVGTKVGSSITPTSGQVNHFNYG